MYIVKSGHFVAKSYIVKFGECLAKLYITKIGKINFLDFTNFCDVQSGMHKYAGFLAYQIVHHPFEKCRIDLSILHF